MMGRQSSQASSTSSRFLVRIEAVKGGALGLLICQPAKARNLALAAARSSNMFFHSGTGTGSCVSGKSFESLAMVDGAIR